jgi:hypothetical protein
MTVLTGFRMEALKLKDRKKYDRVNAMIGDGLKVKSDDIEWNSTVGKLEPKPEREPCPWVCPVTCLSCGVLNCADRLAGTPDVD